MQLTKQLIDEFEREYPPHNGVEFSYEHLMYVRRPMSQVIGYTSDLLAHYASKQQFGLDVWLKQREKVAGLIKDFKRFVEIADQYDFGGVLTDEIEHINRLLQASQPQEQGE